MALYTLEERRLDFDAELRALLATSNTYYEPPANVRLQYPCVVYQRSNIHDTRANDGHYTRRLQFQVTTISLNPDDEWPQMILDYFPYARFNRSFNADGLNHNVILIYY